jgi:uncharacterized protein (TIGR02145 family)
MSRISSLLMLFASLMAGSVVRGQLGCGWNPDYDGDHAIGVPDLLAFLSVFENWDSDGDGVLDIEDDCIGTWDVCGVCNGPGPTLPVIDQIIYHTDSVYVPGLGAWHVFGCAVDTVFSYLCPVPGCMNPLAQNYNPLANLEDGTCVLGPQACGGMASVAYHGHVYGLIGIGNQCWFAENLRSEHYRNGDLIPGNLVSSIWTSTTTGGQSVYGEGSTDVLGGNSDEVANGLAYGRLYNWYAVNDARGLCPAGYHVSTDLEWSALVDSLGGAGVAGLLLKSGPADSPPWNGTNAVGFDALPGGYRAWDSGAFSQEGTHAYWWTSTSTTNGAWSRSLMGTSGVGAQDGVFRGNNNRKNGHSVRCLRD